VNYYLLTINSWKDLHRNDRNFSQHVLGGMGGKITEDLIQGSWQELEISRNMRKSANQSASKHPVRIFLLRLGN
jgi:hypothetical protein